MKTTSKVVLNVLSYQPSAFSGEREPAEDHGQEEGGGQQPPQLAPRLGAVQQGRRDAALGPQEEDAEARRDQERDLEERHARDGHVVQRRDSVEGPEDDERSGRRDEQRQQAGERDASPRQQDRDGEERDTEGDGPPHPFVLDVDQRFDARAEVDSDQGEQAEDHDERRNDPSGSRRRVGREPEREPDPRERHGPVEPDREAGREPAQRRDRTQRARDRHGAERESSRREQANSIARPPLLDGFRCLGLAHRRLLGCPAGRLRDSSSARKCPPMVQPCRFGRHRRSEPCARSQSEAHGDC